MLQQTGLIWSSICEATIWFSGSFLPKLDTVVDSSTSCLLKLAKSLSCELSFLWLFVTRCDLWHAVSNERIRRCLSSCFQMTDVSSCLLAGQNLRFYSNFSDCLCPAHTYTAPFRDPFAIDFCNEPYWWLKLVPVWEL